MLRKPSDYVGSGKGGLMYTHEHAVRGLAQMRIHHKALQSAN